MREHELPDEGPSTTHDPEEARTTTSPPVPGNAIQSVLVVDDDLDIRETLRFALEEEGYQVLEAADGLIAWDILQHSTNQMVVITNHDMPRLDGPGLLNFLAETHVLAGRHAYIYMTAGNRIIPPALAEHLHLLQAQELRKPFELDALLALVSRAADGLVGSRVDLNLLKSPTPAADKPPPLTDPEDLQ